MEFEPRYCRQNRKLFIRSQTVKLLMSESCCTCEGSTVFTVWISSSFYTKPLTFIYSMQQQSYLYDVSIFTNKDTSRCDPRKPGSSKQDGGVLLLNLFVTFYFWSELGLLRDPVVPVTCQKGYTIMTSPAFRSVPYKPVFHHRVQNLPKKLRADPVRLAPFLSSFMSPL